MDDIVLNQEKDLDSLWQKYAKASIDDDRDRKRLLSALEDNYQTIEVV